MSTQLSNLQLPGEGKCLGGLFTAKKECQQLQTEFLNLPAISSAVVLQKGGGIAAVASILKYSETHAYCCFGEEAEGLSNKLVEVEPMVVTLPNKKQTVFQITEIQDAMEGDPRLSPAYLIHRHKKAQRALELAMDNASHDAVGRLNLELEKNITVDLPPGADMELWRDRLGFCVRDSRNLLECSLQAKQLLASISNSNDKSILLKTRPKLQDLIAYDRKVAGEVEREEYLNMILKMEDVEVVSAVDGSGAIRGVSASLPSALLFLYADSEDIAAALLRKVLESMPGSVALTTTDKTWLYNLIRNIPHEEKELRRLHTTAVPSFINWRLAYAINSGMHII